MRYLLLSAFLLLGLGSLQAQIYKIRHDAPIPAKSFMLGFETGGQGGTGQNPNTGERFAFHNYRVRPRLTVFPIKNLGIGIQGEYEWAWTHIAPLQNYYGYGTFLRYYWGSREAGPEAIRIKFNYFAELNYNRSNNSAEQTPDFSVLPRRLANTSYEDMSLTLGIHIRPWKGLVFEIGWGLHYLPQQAENRNWQPGGRLAIDWLFNA